MESLHYFEFCVVILSCCLKIKNKKKMLSKSIIGFATYKHLRNHPDGRVVDVLDF